jgi:hypothetical protein
VSRKKRKRYRRSLKRMGLDAEASASGRTPWGGWGESVELTRGDWQLVRRAANQDWDVPPSVRDTICNQITPSLAAAEQDDRLALGLCRTAIAMDWANIRAEEADLAAQSRLQ